MWHYVTVWNKCHCQLSCDIIAALWKDRITLKCAPHYLVLALVLTRTSSHIQQNPVPVIFQTRIWWQNGKTMPLSEHTCRRTCTHTHAHIDGQRENIMPPAPSREWVEAKNRIKYISRLGFELQMISSYYITKFQALASWPKLLRR